MFQHVLLAILCAAIIKLKRKLISKMNFRRGISDIHILSNIYVKEMR